MKLSSREKWLRKSKIKEIKKELRMKLSSREKGLRKSKMKETKKELRMTMSARRPRPSRATLKDRTNIVLNVCVVRRISGPTKNKQRGALRHSRNVAKLIVMLYGTSDFPSPSSKSQFPTIHFISFSDVQIEMKYPRHFTSQQTTI